VPSDQQELQAIGATAVNAAAIEQQIIKEAAHGEDTVPETAEDDTDELQEQLRAVRRELRAVRAAVDRMQQPEAEAGPRDAAPAPLAQGELQTAVMKQRLAGLVAREATLQSTLAAAGIQDVPDGPTEEALQDVLLAAQRKNSKGKGKGKPPRSAHADLQEDDLFDAAEAAAAAARGRGGGSLVETERDRLIRLGVLTPFDQLGGFERRVERGPSGAEANASIARVGEKVRAMKASRHASKLVDFSELPRPERPAKRVEEGFWRAAASKHDALPKKRRRQTLPRASRKRRARGVAAPDAGGGDSEDASESEASGSEELLDSDAYSSEEEAEALDAKGEFDDADVAEFERRQEAYTRSRRRRRLRRGTGADGDVPPEEGASEESEGEVEDVTFEGGFKVPGDLYAKLFDYQRTAVKWMWELHNQRAGGIIGDEVSRTTQLR